MYAIKPWSRAAIVGGTVGAYALGIGMRWREATVELVDKHRDPSYEATEMRRCILSEHSLRILSDIGCNPAILAKSLRRAKRWKLTTLELHTIREGAAYPGCTPAEPVYTVAEGDLIGALRREFLRYGGHICWSSTAREAYPSPDVKDTWSVMKEFGPLTDAEAIVSFAQDHAEFQQVVFAPPEEDAKAAMFDVQTGICEVPMLDLQVLLGHEYDFAIAMGKCQAMHVWMPRPATFAWRYVTGIKDEQGSPENLHPVLRHMMEASHHVQRFEKVIPATTPQFHEDLLHQRISLQGEALLPVDPFEWRGDRALVDIEGVAELTKALFGKKFYRGYAPAVLREAETDQLMRRADFLRRDMQDAEMFLAERPLLQDDDDDAEPQLKRVGM